MASRGRVSPEGADRRGQSGRYAQNGKKTAQDAPQGANGSGQLGVWPGVAGRALWGILGVLFSVRADGDPRTPGGPLLPATAERFRRGRVKCAYPEYDAFCS